MAVGKNKKLGKKKKGSRKITDPFLKKEWYDVKAPNTFTERNVGKTVVTKTIGQRAARDSLLGRVFEVSLGDLSHKAEDDAFRKFQLKVADVVGRACLTNFYGMDLTTDKLRSMVRKWQTLIEAHTDAKTTDGYIVRLFCIGFTRQQKNQTKKTAYAQSAQVKRIRKKMIEVIQREASNCELSGLVQKLATELIGKEIEKVTQGIFPMQNVMIRKVKMILAPKVDVAKLMDLHGGADAVATETAGAATPALAPVDIGKKVEKAPKKAEEAKDE